MAMPHSDLPMRELAAEIIDDWQTPATAPLNLLQCSYQVMFPRWATLRQWLGKAGLLLSDNSCLLWDSSNRQLFLGYSPSALSKTFLLIELHCSMSLFPPNPFISSFTSTRSVSWFQSSSHLFLLFPLLSFTGGSPNKYFCMSNPILTSVSSRNCTDTKSKVCEGEQETMQYYLCIRASKGKWNGEVNGGGKTLRTLNTLPRNLDFKPVNIAAIEDFEVGSGSGV